MQILIEAPFDLEEKAETNIRSTVEGLERLHDKISRAKVFFKTDDGSGEDSISSEIELHVPGSPVFVSAQAATPMIAFNKAIDKVEHALRKAKSIREDKHKQRL